MPLRLTLLDKTFSDNLLKNATVISANGIRLKALLDNNYKSFWTTKGADTTAIIEFQLKKPKTFTVLQLQENISVGQRIENFVFEYKEGKEWKMICKGTTVGYKRLLRFNPVTAKRVRLRIQSSRLNPTLAEIGMYKETENN